MEAVVDIILGYTIARNMVDTKVLKGANGIIQ